MGFHHVALACRDTQAMHRFYTEVMGFTLVKVNAAPTPGEHGGWAKHFFYATGLNDGTASADSGMVAFWEIHDEQLGDQFPVDINESAGLPWWVNHMAWDAPTTEDFEQHLARWLEHGITVTEIDHDFCRSIYTRDPSGNVVEFCHTLRDFTEEERSTAVDRLHADKPEFDREHAKVTVHRPLSAATN